MIIKNEDKSGCIKDLTTKFLPDYKVHYKMLQWSKAQ